MEVELEGKSKVLKWEGTMAESLQLQRAMAEWRGEQLQDAHMKTMTHTNLQKGKHLEQEKKKKFK